MAECRARGDALASTRLDGERRVIEQPPDALPILFSPAMVRAERAGLKNQTRRVIKPQPIGVPWYWEGDEVDPRPGWFDGFEEGWDPRGGAIRDVNRQLRCPYGAPGTLLWVRERMRVVELRGGAIRVRYEADGAESDWIAWPERLKGTPRLGHCLAYGGFREASRTLLKVSRIRVERLQDISEGDARAEGVAYCDEPGHADCFYRGTVGYRCAFERLWDSINGKRPGCSWEANSWVWVVDFVRFEPKREAA